MGSVNFWPPIVPLLQYFISLLLLVVAKPHQLSLLPPPPSLPRSSDDLTGTSATIVRAPMTFAGTSATILYLYNKVLGVPARIFIQCKNKFALKFIYLIACGFPHDSFWILFYCKSGFTFSSFSNLDHVLLQKWISPNYFSNLDIPKLLQKWICT